MRVDDFGAQNVAGMEGSTNISKEVKERYVKSLAEAGAPKELSNFFTEVLQCECDINNTIHKWHQGLTKDTKEGNNPMKLFKNVQELCRNFNRWKSGIESLSLKSKDVPPFDMHHVKVGSTNKSMCVVETNEINVKEGDDLLITDTSQPNRLKVKNSRGEEGFIPALSCLLPSPDKNAFRAVERLQMYFIASWTECVKRVRLMLTENLVNTSRLLVEGWRTVPPSASPNVGSKNRVDRRLKRLSDIITKQAPHWDLNKLHTVIYGLERELTTWNTNGTDLTPMIETLANLDKAVLCYQMFLKQWFTHRKAMEKSSRPIRVFESWDLMRPLMRNQRNVRYYEVRMVKNTIEIVEEIARIKKPSSGEEESWQTDVAMRRETVETDQISHAEREEHKRFIIRAVLDPITKEEISIQEAITRGVVDQQRGLYINPRSGENISIPEAMNTGKILVEFSTTTKTKEATKAVGLITIKTKVDNRPYAILKVIDSETGEKVEPLEAKKRHLLDEMNATWMHRHTGDVLPLDAAIEQGWVIVEYDPESGDPEFIMKTYAISAVVDQVQRKKIPFEDAVAKGLIEGGTGNYVNNVTGERVYVGEAIRRGFLKAKEVENTAGLNVDAENRMVVEKMDVIRKNVLKSMGVLNAFKKGASSS